MGQFKPMVKMMTTEPSVILKLKKGGHVASKKEAKEENGHSPMACDNKYTEEGESPKKPSMSERRKSMNMATMKKGGKAMGGLQGNPNMVSPVTQSMPPAVAARMRQLATAEQNMTGVPAMKKGGKTDMSQDKALVKKAFKQHDSQEHKGGKGTKLKLKMGGTIEGNEGKFAKTKVVDGDKTDKAHGTGSIKEQNAGGFKKGGMVNCSRPVNTAKAGVTNRTTGDVKEKNGGGYKNGGTVDWANRPANSTPPGVTNRTTGEVREANAGGFKKGGTAKKAFATGGSVVDDGKAQKMPSHFVSRPVANSLQSGTFKKGGKVKKFAEGGETQEDMSRGAYDSVAKADRMENEGMRNSILNAPSNAYNAIKRMLGVTPESTAGAGRGNINPPNAKARGR